MDINFTSPDEIPLPADEVRIRYLHVRPLPDQKRLRITLEVDPSQERPNADFKITDDRGNEIATTSIIESISRTMEITMHLRESEKTGPFFLDAELYFARLVETEKEEEITPIQRKIVDHAQVDFTL